MKNILGFSCRNRKLFVPLQQSCNARKKVANFGSVAQRKSRTKEKAIRKRIKLSNHFNSYFIMAKENIAFLVNLRKNTAEGTDRNGRYYPEAETKTALSTKGFAKHLA